MFLLMIVFAAICNHCGAFAGVNRRCVRELLRVTKERDSVDYTIKVCDHVFASLCGLYLSVCCVCVRVYVVSLCVLCLVSAVSVLFCTWHPMWFTSV